MSLIQVQGLTFHYEGSPESIFENASFQLDTDWRLGFISRNGRGKTTLLRILHGELPYQGRIDASVRFEYFPYPVRDESGTALDVVRAAVAPFDAWQAEMDACLARGDEAALDRFGTLQELMLQHDAYTIDEQIAREAGRLGVGEDVLTRPFQTLSHGERTKLLIAALFLRKNSFLLIDEPTNHLDADGRAALQAYLATKKGFILVSHDRALLDGVCDHILSINRADIEVQRGDYSTWKENHDLREQFELRENERLRGEIGHLTVAMRRNADWSDKLEATKIGSHAGDRGAIGAQAARMMKRSKAIEKRVQTSIGEKQSLLKNVETADALKIQPLPYFKQRLLEVVDLQIDYGDSPLFAPQTFSLSQGDRLSLGGHNGSGKSSVLRLLLGEAVPHRGEVRLGSRLITSYVSQDTSHLRGTPHAYAQAAGIDVTLFLTILRKLDFPREAFERPIEAYSGGQKKKVLLAASLATQAHLYIWDEPLNFVDILSRVQIEDLLRGSAATMIFVEHDRNFVDAIATRTIVLS